ncbi:hypothetical protein E1263_42440, partial [Kribbella antibiotica]
LPGPTAPADASSGTRLWPKLLSSPAAPPPLGSGATTAPSATAHPEVLDAALVLLADHGLAVSTVAARVAASARANLYAVVSAGLGALDGQYHGAAPTLAYEFLDRAKHDPVGALSAHLRTGTPVPGFGHKIYRTRDPRAEVLFKLLGDEPIMQVVQTLTGRIKSFPTSDLALAAVMHAYNLRPDAGEALFALARIVGWTARATSSTAERRDRAECRNHVIEWKDRAAVHRLPAAISFHSTSGGCPARRVNPLGRQTAPMAAAGAVLVSARHLRRAGERYEPGSAGRSPQPPHHSPTSQPRPAKAGPQGGALSPSEPAVPPHTPPAIYGVQPKTAGFPGWEHPV